MSEAQRGTAAAPVEGADPPPRWTLRRLVAHVRERFGRLCCRETIRTALHRLKLLWKKAKKYVSEGKKRTGELVRYDPRQKAAPASDAGTKR